MSSYIFIKNFYLEEIQKIIQDQVNSNYPAESNLEVEILMKNSRSYFIQFNQEFAIEELLDWMNTLYENNPENERETIIEGNLSMNQIHYNFYYSNEEMFGTNSENKTFKIVDLEELVEIENSIKTFSKTEIPTKNIHSMGIIKHHIPKKKWWKIW